MKKIILIIVCFFSVLCLSALSVSANNTINDFYIPLEWTDVDYDASPVLVDELTIHTSNGTRRANMLAAADPNMEYSFKYSKAYDSTKNNTYIAVLGTFYMNPSNKDNKMRAKSDLLRVSISAPDGKLVESAPLSANSSYQISTNIGGSLSIGFQGTLPTGSITGSFSRTKTKTIWDLDVTGNREKIHSYDPSNNKFTVDYDYVDAHREDVGFLETSTATQYAAIFLVNGNASSLDLNITIYVNFFYDGWLWNNYYDKTTSFSKNVS